MQASSFIKADRRELAPEQGRILLDVAREAILTAFIGTAGAQPQRADIVSEVDPPARLRSPGASFVTLLVDGRLQGCVGSLAATRPLFEDVYENARRTAFADPRFPPLRLADIESASIEISVLSAPHSIDARTEQQLLSALRPGLDGLILRRHERRATFLPKVWETLPEPSDFVRRLKQKMGLPDDFWDAAMVAERYHTRTVRGPLCRATAAPEHGH